MTKWIDKASGQLVGDNCASCIPLPTNPKFVLPFPPSVNAMYGGGSGQKRFPSKKYKAWLKSCPKLVPLMISQEVDIHYTFTWPDNRVRDGQNYMKAVLDYLVNEGVLQDDNWKIVVGETWVHKGVQKNEGKVEVEIILQ